MAAPSEKLAASLSLLEELQKGGRRVFRSRELTRVHRERLVRNGFLREVMKGWLISAGPDVAAGDTTPWFASYRDFCASYCRARFGEDWHLSPEQSLRLQAEKHSHPAATRHLLTEGHQQHRRASVRYIALRPQAAGDASTGRSG